MIDCHEQKTVVKIIGSQRAKIEVNQVVRVGPQSTKGVKALTCVSKFF